MLRLVPGLLVDSGPNMVPGLLVDSGPNRVFNHLILYNSTF